MSWLFLYIAIFGSLISVPPPPAYFFQKTLHPLLPFLHLLGLPSFIRDPRVDLVYIKLISCILLFHSFMWRVVMRCTIWYHLYNLKNVKNIYDRVLLLVKLQTYQCDFLSFFLTQALFNFVLCPSLIHSKLFSVNVIE